MYVSLSQNGDGSYYMTLSWSWPNGADFVDYLVAENGTVFYSGRAYRVSGTTSKSVRESTPLWDQSSAYYASVTAFTTGGTYIESGSDYCTMWSIYIPPGPTRPSNFTGSLYTTNSSGNDVVSASQWNSFLNKINEFRVYKGYTNYSYQWKSYAVAGNDFKAYYFNEALSAMSAICSNLPNTRYAGDNVYKNYFDTMVSSLNSIS